MSNDPFAGATWPGNAARRRVRVRRRVAPTRRYLKWGLLGVGVLAVLGLGWVLVTGLIARSELDSARADVAKLRVQLAAGKLDEARSTAHDFAEHASRAHSLTTGPAWAVSAAVPWAGDPLATVRAIAAGVDHLGTAAMPDLVNAGALLSPGTLRAPDGTIGLAKIVHSRPLLDDAASVVTSVLGRIREHTDTSWFGPVDSSRSAVLRDLGGLNNDVSLAALVAKVLPPMLGDEGAQRYLLVFQNSAEARGTGGLPGAFATLEVRDGVISFTRFVSDDALIGVHSTLQFGSDYDHLYGGAATTTLVGNANLTANFPYPAAIWADMWQRKYKQHVDGVIALDPTALSYLLTIVGARTLPDGTLLDASNVVELTQKTLYARYPAVAQAVARHRYLIAIARAVSTQLTSYRGDSALLVAALGKAVGERRLLVWSATPSIEAALETTPIGGAIPETQAPYVGLSVVNDGGNKLDYYLDRSVTWQRKGCGSTRQVTVTIALTNTAPAHGLPAFVTLRSDQRDYAVMKGDNRLEVSYYATRGALMNSIDVDGSPSVAAVGAERGHPVYVVDLEMPRGVTRTITLHLTEPAGSGAPIVLRQPLVRPLHVSVDDGTC